MKTERSGAAASLLVIAAVTQWVVAMPIYAMGALGVGDDVLTPFVVIGGILGLMTVLPFWADLRHRAGTAESRSVVWFVAIPASIPVGATAYLAASHAGRK